MNRKPKMRPSGPWHLDKVTWWYREPSGDITLVHEDRDAADAFVRTNVWRITGPVKAILPGGAR